MLTQLQYLNFKSWQSTGLLNLAPITGFFGTNSSGKTSLLQALLLLKQTAESSDRNQILDFGDSNKYVDLGSYEETIYQHQPVFDLNFKLEWVLQNRLKIEDPEDSRKILFEGIRMHFDVDIAQESRRQVVADNFSYQLGGHHFQMLKERASNGYKIVYEGPNKDFKFIKRQMRAWPLPPPVKFYGFPDQVKSYYQNAGFLTDLQLELERLLQSIYYLGPLREYPQRQYIWKGNEPEDMGRRGERAVDAILVSDSQGRKIARGKGKRSLLLGEYVAFWLRELGLISSFDIKEIKEGSGLFQVWVKKNDASTPVLITDVGFGVSQILPVITLCYYVPEGSILIIEQPEIHLHPKVQAGLADVFIDAVKTRKIQILLESHSEHLLRRLQRGVAEEKVHNSDIQLYFCEMANGKSEIKGLEMDAFGSIRNWPKEFFGDEFGEIAAINLAKLNRLKAS